MQVPKLELRRLPTGIKVDRRRPIRTPLQAAEILGPLLAGLEVEVAAVLLLDAGHRAIGVVEVARGAQNAVHVSPRELFRTAIHVGALAFVIAHNHPSNDVVPSDDDLALTKRIEAAADLLGLRLLDHLVFGDHEFYSCATGQRNRWAAAETAGR